MKMASEYDFSAIEKKWQKYWEENQTFKAVDFSPKPKYYCLDMFPYPSGAGLHVGHPEGYTATDILCRYRRMKGFNVLHPMGWDAFGLPAEQYAIETGTHPEITTEKNVDNFRRQIKALGFSYDWSREINTTRPAYFKWTQWIFSQLHKKGLAYLDEIPVNWCPALGTVLANEEVINGLSERGSHPVIRRPMKQWMLRITEYAERLLNDLDELDWPEGVKEMQRNWIGKSTGAEVKFMTTAGEAVTVYTTRPDTLFGATYMVLAPEHPLVDALTTPDRKAEVDASARRPRRRANSPAPAKTARKPAPSPALTRPTRLTGGRFRSGSPTMCWFRTEPVRSWRSRRTTRGISSLPEPSICRSSASLSPIRKRRKPKTSTSKPFTAAKRAGPAKENSSIRRTATG